MSAYMYSKKSARPVCKTFGQVRIVYFANSCVWDNRPNRVRTLNLLDTCGVEMDSMYWIHAVWKWIDFFMI